MFARVIEREQSKNTTTMPTSKLIYKRKMSRQSVLTTLQQQC